MEARAESRLVLACNYTGISPTAGCGQSRDAARVCHGLVQLEAGYACVIPYRGSSEAWSSPL